MLEILVTVILGIACFAVWAVLIDPHRFSRAYDKAMEKDLKYAREHPGCSWDDAHREREKVYRRHGL